MRLRFVRRGRDLGLSIADIRTLLVFCEEGGNACSDVQAISERHLDEIRSRIADLSRLESALEALIAPCGRGQTQCPALRQLFRSEEHTSELQSLMRISYAVLCLKKKKLRHRTTSQHLQNN